MSFQNKVKDKNLVTVFYECGAGGEFLVYLLGMHPFISSRNFSKDSSNRWAICDNFCRMAGRGLEESLDNWQFPPNYKWYIARDHANLLCPTRLWTDKNRRTIEQGITDFNNLYSNYWNKSKTVWLDLDSIDTLKSMDNLGAVKNFGAEHVHLTDNEYADRYKDIKSRLDQKRKTFTGDYICIDIEKLWHSDTKSQFEAIIEFLELDDSFLEIWLHLVDFWNKQNNNQFCSKTNCVPIGL